MVKQKKSVSTVAVSIIMILISVVVLYPFLYVLAYSLSSSESVMTNNITIFPIDFTLGNFAEAFKMEEVYRAFAVSIFRSVVGAFWAVLITSLAAYSISKKDLPGRKWFNIFFIIPMYISGGLIPYYIVIRDLNLFNNLLVYILPHGFYAFNMLLMKTHFDAIPVSLEESAEIDGAGHLRIYLSIILPLSVPVLIVIAMFTAVWQWNEWFDVVLFITKTKLYPLQRVLQVMMEQSSTSVADLVSGAIQGGNQRTISPESLRMATLIITTIPIVLIYPFVQKFFVKGVMIGAVKG